MNGKAFLACVLMSVVLTGCETAKKISQVIRNPDIQVGKLMEQSTELTVTLLTEPDSNLTADGEAAPVDVQLVYLSRLLSDCQHRAARCAGSDCHHRAARRAGEKLYRSPGLQPVAGYRKNTAADPVKNTAADQVG